jgi:hypothetical protein
MVMNDKAKRMLRRTFLAGAGTTATRWTISPPAVWPPPDGSSLVVRAARVWRRLRTVVFQDHLASDARFAIDTRWTIIAPDRDVRRSRPRRD